MSDLFNAAEGRELRDKGIEAVASFPNDEWVTRARAVAINIALRHGTVTADDVRREFPAPPPHPNCFGAVFKNKGFKATGEFRQSAVKSRHAGLQRVWSYEQ